MDDPTNITPGGAPVLDCEHDHECTVLTCDFCLKDLPANNNTLREEGKDYVAHFCGLDCLEAWHQRHAREKRLEKQQQ